MKINKENKMVLFFKGNDMCSNFYRYDFKYKNHTFNTSEQAFMWEKAMYFNDFEIANQILKTTHPNQAKSLGRKVKNYDDREWNCIRFNIMRDVVFAKIEQLNELKQFLIKHKKYTFVEASPYDEIWGVKLSENNPKILDSKQWRGENLLGQVFNLWLAIYNISQIPLSKNDEHNEIHNLNLQLPTIEQRKLINQTIDYFHSL